MLLALLLFSFKKDGFDLYAKNFLMQKVISLWILLEINFLQVLSKVVKKIAVLKWFDISAKGEEKEITLLLY